MTGCYRRTILSAPPVHLMRRVDGSLFNPHNDGCISITGAAPRGRYTGGEKILGLAELIIPRILRGNGLIQVIGTVGIHGVKIFLSIHGTTSPFYIWTQIGRRGIYPSLPICPAFCGPWRSVFQRQCEGVPVLGLNLLYHGLERLLKMERTKDGPEGADTVVNTA